MVRRDATGKKCVDPVMDLSQVNAMSIHTQQQTIILEELQSTRRKLEQENQRLRDELEDANLVIKVLKLRLRENVMGHQNSSRRLLGLDGEDDRGDNGSPQKSESKPQFSISKIEWTRRRRSKMRQQMSNQDAFKNPSFRHKKGGFAIDRSRVTAPKVVAVSTTGSAKTVAR